VAKASAWAEVLGYMGSIALSCHKLQQLNAQEAQLARKVEALMKVRGWLEAAGGAGGATGCAWSLWRALLPAAACAVLAEYGWCVCVCECGNSVGCRAQHRRFMCAAWLAVAG
jgi:hypothetical protein